MAVAKIPKRMCSVEGCIKPVDCRGFCSSHYWRWKRHGDPLGGGTPKGELMRWIKRHAYYKGDDCLEWPFGRFPTGYGMIFIKGISHNAHRIMCKIVHGNPPTKYHQAAHNCGNGCRGCMNPNHLRWATIAENRADTVRDQLARGEKVTYKLNSEQVREIRRLRKKNRERWTMKRLAAKFNVSVYTISAICNGVIWKWLE